MAVDGGAPTELDTKTPARARPERPSGDVGYVPARSLRDDEDDAPAAPSPPSGTRSLERPSASTFST